MTEASFSEVLEVILIFLLIYFGFRLLIRWFGPMLLRYFLKKVGQKVEKKFGQSWSQEMNNTSRKDRPEVDINPKGKPKHPRSKKDVGEYIDYEEIE